jgi:tetratricopeptide (TPR) repeat protein
MRDAKLFATVCGAALALTACAMVPAGKAPVSSPQPVATSVAGVYLVAHLAAAEGNLKEAGEFYSDLLKNDPTDPTLLNRAFLNSATAGDLDRAIPLASRLLERVPENRPAHLILAMAALKKKDYATANVEIVQSGTDVYSNLTNWIVIAWSLAGRGKSAEALMALDQLSGQMGLEGLYAFHKALMFDYLGRDKEADTAYRTARMITGEDSRTIDAYGRFLRRHGRTDDANALYGNVGKSGPSPLVPDASLTSLATNKVPAPIIGSPAEGVAEGLFAIAASLNGQSGDDRATAASSTGQNGDAGTVADSPNGQSSNDGLLDRQNDDEVVILYLHLALYLRPDFDVARTLLGNRYEQMGKYDLANAVYDKVPASSPYHPMIAIREALNESRLGNNDLAIAELTSLGEERQTDVDVWRALGDLYRNVDRSADAVGAYNKAIALTGKSDPNLVALYYAQGVALESVNRWEDAERDFRAALAIDPDSADVLNFLGYSWVDRGEHVAEAVVMLEKAHALRPMDGDIADSVGWAYFKLGRFDEAAQTLEEAVLLAPAESEINDHLGDAYWRIGRKIDARFEWSHALSLGPEAKDRPAIEKKLQLGLDAATASGS